MTFIPKNLLLHFWAQFRQTMFTVIMTTEGFTKIVSTGITLEFGAGVLVLECGYIVHIVKMHYFFFSKFTLLLGVDKTNSAYSNDEQEMVYQTFKFHDSHTSWFRWAWSYMYFTHCEMQHCFLNPYYF